MSDQEKEIENEEELDGLSDPEQGLDDVDEEFYDEAGFSEDEEFIEEDWEAFDDEFEDEVPEKAAKKKGGLNKFVIIGVAVVGGGIMMMMGGGDEQKKPVINQQGQLTSTVVKKEEKETFIPYADDAVIPAKQDDSNEPKENLGGILNDPDLLSKMEQEVDERYYDTDFYYDDEGQPTEQDVVFEGQEGTEKPPMPAPIVQEEIDFADGISFEEPVMPMPSPGQEDSFDPPSLNIDEIIDVQIAETKDNIISEQGLDDVDEAGFFEDPVIENTAKNEDSLTFPDVEDFMISDPQATSDVNEQEVVLEQENEDLKEASMDMFEEDFTKDFEESFDANQNTELNNQNNKLNVADNKIEPVLNAGVSEEVSAEVFDKLDEILNRIDSVESSVNDMKGKAALKSDIPDIRSLQSSITALEKRIDKISKEQRALINNAGKLNAGTNTKPYSRENEVKTMPYEDRGEENIGEDIVKTLSINSDWVLKSAQPGKAWVSREGDNSLTNVSIGDKLEGVGKITRIDILQGKWVVEGTNSKIVQ